MKFIASHCVNCLKVSLVCLFLCSYSALSSVASKSSCFLPCIYNSEDDDNNNNTYYYYNNNKYRERHRLQVQEPLFRETNIRDSAVTWVQAFSVTPFLGTLKLQKGTHWALSSQFLINPFTPKVAKTKNHQKFQISFFKIPRNNLSPMRTFCQRGLI